MVLSALHVLVDLGEALVNIPEKKHSQAGGSSRLAIIFALEDPVLVVFLRQNKQVLAKSGIDEGVDVCESQVFLGAVDTVCLEAAVFKMGFEDGIRVLWLHHVQVSCE